MNTKALSILTFILAITFNINAERKSLSLKESEWNIWLDKEAEWENDILYQPRNTDLSVIKAKAPTGGWNNLYGNKNNIQCVIPATERIFC